MDENLKNKIGNNNPFKTPENYFDYLPEKISEKIAAKNSAKSKPLFGIKTGLVGLSSLALILFAIYQFSIPEKQQQAEIKTEFTVTKSDSVIEKNDSAVLVESPKNKKVEVKEVVEPEKNLDENITDDDIIEFLMEEDFEIDLL